MNIKKILELIIMAILWCLIVFGILTLLGITPDEFSKIPRYGG